MSKHEAEAVTLQEVTAALIEPLLRYAQSDAAPSEVTPDVGEGELWSEGRRAWFRDFHAGSEPVLEDPGTYKTWIVSVTDQMSGSVRLALLDHPRVAEAGIWIGRTRRRAHVGQRAMEALIEVARGIGVGTLIANTTRSNVGALRMLEKLGATLSESAGEAIQARIRLVGP